MGAFDTAFKPRALTPANTSVATLFTCGTHSPIGEDAQVNINASVIGTTTCLVRIGITPAGGTQFWIVHDDPVTADNPIIGLGPIFLQSGDSIDVRTSVANAVTFSVSGTNSS